MNALTATMPASAGFAAPFGWAFPMVSFDAIELHEANDLLVAWGHKMGPCIRGNARGWSHALRHEGRPVAVAITATLIRERVGGAAHLTRENTIELARLCAERPGLCRVALRLWREFVLPALPYQYAMSYQDADLHNGHTYRFDGWQRVARSRSGTDSRSGRKGRDKWVWQYPPNDRGQAQPPEANMACNDDVRVSISGQLPGAAAVACTVWFAARRSQK